MHEGSEDVVDQPGAAAAGTPDTLADDEVDAEFEKMLVREAELSETGGGRRSRLAFLGSGRGLDRQ